MVFSTRCFLCNKLGSHPKVFERPLLVLPCCLKLKRAYQRFGDQSLSIWNPKPAQMQAIPPNIHEYTFVYLSYLLTLWNVDLKGRRVRWEVSTEGRKSIQSHVSWIMNKALSPEVRRVLLDRKGSCRDVRYEAALLLCCACFVYKSKTVPLLSTTLLSFEGFLTIHS